MDLTAARDAINELIAIDDELAKPRRDGGMTPRDLDEDEWRNVLAARKKVAEERLREVGFVAAHDAMPLSFRRKEVQS